MPGWIKTTATRAALGVLRSRNRLSVVDISQDNSAGWLLLTPSTYGSEVDAGMLDAERRAAVRNGLAELTESHRKLLGLLVADPPISYQQISDQLGLPVGSIGPTRARCLRKLAATTAIRALEPNRSERASTADAAQGRRTRTPQDRERRCEVMAVRSCRDWRGMKHDLNQFSTDEVRASAGHCATNIRASCPLHRHPRQRADFAQECQPSLSISLTPPG
jgi:hypothetical protein